MTLSRLPCPRLQVVNALISCIDESKYISFIYFLLGQIEFIIAQRFGAVFVMVFNKNGYRKVSSFGDN